MRIVSLLLVTLLFTAPVVAQTATEETSLLDEIVVTAQKREQNLRDVPISMSVISGEILEETGAGNLRELTKFTPNVRVDPVYKDINIRGLGGTTGELTEQSVAVIIDDVYYGRPTYISTAFLDIERFEVLRGPQGTIVGKNSSAGAVLFHSAQPGFDWTASGNVQFGELEERKYDAMLSGPIIADRLAFRLSLATHERDGHVENFFTDRFDGGFDNKIGKLRLLARLTDSLSLTLTYGMNDQFLSAARTEFFVLTDEGKAVHGLFDPRVEDIANNKMTADQPSWRAHDGYWLTGKLDWEFAPFTITAVTGWAESDDSFDLDADGGPAPLITLEGAEGWTQISQEIRLVSNPGRFEYIAGVYAYRSELNGWHDLHLPPAIGADRITALAIPDAVGSALSPLTQTIVDLIATPAGATVYADYQQISTTLAAFGQVKVGLFDRLDLTAGLRLNKEVKETRMLRDMGPDGSEPILTAAIQAEDFDLRKDLKEDDISWSVSALYDVTDNMTAYLTRSRGFKGGGFNSAALEPRELEYGPETSDTWETGIKSRLLSGALMLNVGGYYTEFQDLQVQVQTGSITTGFVARNAAVAIVQGIEVDAMMMPLAGLLLTASGAYNDATYDTWKNAPCPSGNSDGNCDLSGRELTNAPEWAGTFSASYRAPLFNAPFNFFMRGDAVYTDKYFMAADLDPNDARAALWQFNAAIGLGGLDDIWEFTLHGHNLTDEFIRVRAGDASPFEGSHEAEYEAPRLFVASFRVRF